MTAGILVKTHQAHFLRAICCALKVLRGLKAFVAAVV